MGLGGVLGPVINVGPVGGIHRIGERVGEDSTEGGVLLLLRFKPMRDAIGE